MKDAEFAVEGPRRPRHVAIIMDGNGRWATARGLSRLAGHRAGVEALREIVEACPDFGVETLTLFAFSTENWRRPGDEVAGLMTLIRRYFRRESADLAQRGARVVFIGERARLDSDIRAMMASLEARTAGNDKLTILIALNYGGRAEITAAARRLGERVRDGDVAPEEIDETSFAAALDTNGFADPDLVIRTSGEQRISNFLLWQCAYSEFVFADELWPDFDRAAFERALGAFDRRERRFGAVAG